MSTTPIQDGPRRRRAAIVGFGLDGPPRPHRMITGEDRLLFGGSEATREALIETMLRLDAELERLGVDLGDLAPPELAELAWRIDSPELAAVAVRLDEGLRRLGRTFEDSTAAELTAIAAGDFA